MPDEFRTTPGSRRVLMKKLGQLKHLQVHLRPQQVSIYVTCIYVTCFNRHKLLMHTQANQASF